MKREYAMKTLEEHTTDFIDANDKLFQSQSAAENSERVQALRELVRNVFDTCIEVCQDEVDALNLERRYQNKGEAHTMASGILRQLKSLRGGEK
jgi:AAA+ superfamily predicted ATPase